MALSSNSMAQLHGGPSRLTAVSAVFVLASQIGLVGLVAGNVLLFAGEAVAADLEWTVQIGALRRPDAGFAAAAETVAPVRTTQTREGLTRFRVGRFDDPQDAERALGALRRAGYADAYVVQTRGAAAGLPAVSAGPPPTRGTSPTSHTSLTPHTSPTSHTSPTPHTSPRLNPSRDGEQVIESLPESLRSRVVYLDGVLHVKDGDRFTPLAEHLAEHREP